MSQAVEFHKKCLRLNPFLWSSFEALCNFGEKVEPSKYFTTVSAINFFNYQVKSSINSPSGSQENVWNSELGRSINLSQDPGGYNLNDLFTKVITCMCVCVCA